MTQNKLSNPVFESESDTEQHPDLLLFLDSITEDRGLTRLVIIELFVELPEVVTGRMEKRKQYLEENREAIFELATNITTEMQAINKNFGNICPSWH